MFPEEIQTSRLTLQRLSTNNVDLKRYHQVCSVNEPEIEKVTKHIPGFDPHRTLKQTKEFIEHAEEKWESGEKAEYIIRPQESEPNGGEIAGGARLSVKWEKQVGDLGIWLRKPFWGRGYSSERAVALMDMAFNQLNLQVVQAICVNDNKKSKKAVEKYMQNQGGKHEGVLRNWMVDSDGTPLDCHRFTITKEEFNS